MCIEKREMFELHKTNSKCLAHLQTFFNSISDGQTFKVTKQNSGQMCSADNCNNKASFLVEKVK